MCRVYLIKLLLFSSAILPVLSKIYNITKVKQQQMDQEDEILYEMDVKDTFEHIIMPENCSTPICENIPNWPNNDISELINIMIADGVEFKMDKEIQLDEQKETDLYRTIITEDKGVELCRSKPISFRPKAVKDPNNSKWYFVVNSDWNIVQRFNGEACLGSPNESCSNIATFQRNYEGRCIQKYRSRSMIVLSTDLKKIIKKSYPVPTCCSCVAFSTS